MSDPFPRVVPTLGGLRSLDLVLCSTGATGEWNHLRKRHATSQRRSGAAPPEATRLPTPLKSFEKLAARLFPLFPFFLPRPPIPNFFFLFFCFSFWIDPLDLDEVVPPGRDFEAIQSGTPKDRRFPDLFRQSNSSADAPRRLDLASVIR